VREGQRCGGMDWIGSVVCTYELVIYIHSINSKEGPWLSTYREKMFQNSRDIVTKRDIATVPMYIKDGGGNTCKENYVCWFWEGMYVVMEIDIVIAGGKGSCCMGNWIKGSLMFVGA